MNAVSAEVASSDLFRLMDEVNASGPLRITGRRANAVLVGENDWHVVQETVHVATSPGMTESIRLARAEGIDSGATESEW